MKNDNYCLAVELVVNYYSLIRTKCGGEFLLCGIASGLPFFSPFASLNILVLFKVFYYDFVDGFSRDRGDGRR